MKDDVFAFFAGEARLSSRPTLLDASPSESSSRLRLLGDDGALDMVDRDYGEILEL